MLGQKIRAMRLRKGISQEKLAEQLSISQPTLGRIEQGKSKFDAEMLPRLCLALGVEINDLFHNDCLNSSKTITLEGYVSNIQQSIENLKDTHVREVNTLKDEIIRLNKKK